VVKLLSNLTETRYRVVRGVCNSLCTQCAVDENL
jgi:hypothetical protein